MPRNLDWTRDELILALDTYFRLDVTRTTKDNSEIIVLSELLNRLPVHDGQPVDQRFRNPNGVYMKLCNFLRLDPNYTGKGLDAGSRLDQVVWDEFANNRDLLARTAEAIRHNYAAVTKADGLEENLTAEEEEFPEGRVLTRLHKMRERNARLVKRKKEKVLKDTGRLACEVCGFDFAEVYGSLGNGFAECHHTVPLADLKFSNQHS
jgi:5-methylcytosine-specific restriction protein A